MVAPYTFLVSVPDERFARLWPELSEELRRRLDAGEKILLHCRGGRGRPGLVACCLAVECGAAPADALRRVRKARPRATNGRRRSLSLTAFLRRPSV